MKKRGNKILASVLALSMVLPSAGAMGLQAEAASQTSDFGLETAYQIAAEGTVLLKNEDKALPLEKNSKVNVFGVTQLQTFLGGSGSGSGSIADPVYLTDALKAEGFQVNEELYQAYDAYWNAEENWEEVSNGWGGTTRRSLLRRCIEVIDGVGLGQAFSEYVIGYTEMSLSEQQLAQAKEFSDTAVILLSRSGSEGADLAESDMKLFEEEKQMVDQVAKTFSKVIVLFNTCTTLEMGFLEEYPNIKAAAIMWAPGIRGCEAVADILSGDVNPSGKLADTAAYEITDYPSNENFGVFYEEDGTTRYLEYEEGIYVGYRYFDTFDKEVQFPFGYGLSYTNFSMDVVSSHADANQVTMDVKVTNTGDVAGKQVVEVYYGAPDGTLEKPKKELAAFVKTDLLQPKESQTVTVIFQTQDMSSYSEAQQAYLLEAGTYQFYVGDSSAAVKSAGTYTIGETVVYKTDAVTGAEIQNLFADERTESLTLLSKNQTESTYPTKPTTAVSIQTGEKQAKALTDEETEVFEVQARTAEETTEETTGIQLKDVYENETLWNEFLAQFTDDELILYLMNGEFKTLTYDKYGIPRMDMKDGPANIQAGTGGWGGDIGTSFPVAVMLACTWNADLAENYGTAAGLEAKAFVNQDGSNAGTEVWYAPALNIHRNPRCGRNFEYYSEDPVLAGSIAAAATVGAQNQGLQVALKHFAVNNQETGRVGVNTYADERTLREIYLKAFEIPVKAGARAIMSSFNSIGTTWAAANKALLVDLLRTEWGFDGFVITDAYMDVTAEKWPNTQDLIYAENNLFLSSQTSTTEGRYLTEYNTIKGELEAHPEFRSQLEKNVRQVLQVLMKTYAFSDVLGSEENVTFTRKVNLFTLNKTTPTVEVDTPQPGNPQPDIAVSKIVLNAGTQRMTIGSTYRIQAEVSPENAANKALTYTSSKTGVATVSAAGVVTAKAAGEAIITVTAKDGSGVKAQMTILVKPAKVKSVKAAKTKSGKVKLTWKKVQGASGYVIYRASKKNGAYKKIAVIKGGSKARYTKSTYRKNAYYRIRAYKTINGKKVLGAASGSRRAK